MTCSSKWGYFHEKKSRFSCHVMEIKPRKLNQCLSLLSISWMAAALCRLLIRNCPTLLCAITCHRNFSQTEDHSAKEAWSKKRYNFIDQIGIYYSSGKGGRRRQNCWGISANMYLENRCISKYTKSDKNLVNKQKISFNFFILE